MSSVVPYTKYCSALVQAVSEAIHKIETMKTKSNLDFSSSRPLIVPNAIIFREHKTECTRTCMRSDNRADRLLPNRYVGVNFKNSLFEFVGYFPTIGIDEYNRGIIDVFVSFFKHVKHIFVCFFVPFCFEHTSSLPSTTVKTGLMFMRLPIFAFAGEILPPRARYFISSTTK